MAVLLIALLFFLAAALAAVLGAGLLAILPLAVAVLVVGWFLLTLASGRAPADTVRETEHPQLLGPGGPDDPEAAQSPSSSSGAGSGSGRSISSGG